MPAGAVATKGVLGDACAAGYRERRGMADGGASTLSGLAILFLHGRNVAPFGRQAGLVAEGVHRVENGFVS